MAPFLAPQTVLNGFKERAEAVTIQAGGAEPKAELVETKKALSRKAIEQLCYVKDVNSLAVLSDSTSLTATSLAKSKQALSMATYTGVVHSVPDNNLTLSPEEFGKGKDVPSVLTHLAIGCKRKIVIYSWKDGEPQDPQETTLSHSPRTMSFLGENMICFGYALSDYALYYLKTATMIEIATPIPSVTSGTSISNMGMGALTNLGGYMGIGAKARPWVVSIHEGEALIARDNNGLFVGPDGKMTRDTHIDWPAPPEELAFMRPYVFAVMPSGTVPSSQLDGASSLASTSQASTSFTPSPVVEIRSSISMSPVQCLPFPPVPADDQPTATPIQHSVRLLTSLPTKYSLFLVTTPTDRATANAQGSSIWQFRMKSWSEQLDELAVAGSHADALALLDLLDVASLPDKEQRRKVVRALNAVAEFKAERFDRAMDTFIELDINPAKVVALYPPSIAGRLSVPQEEWIPLFGGPVPPKPESKTPSIEQNQDGVEGQEQQRPPSPKGSIRASISGFRTGLENIVSPTRSRDDDTVSVIGRPKGPPKDAFHRSVETLMRYLSDRRPKVDGALKALNITSAEAHRWPNLSAASPDELYALPNVPLSALTPEELVRFAQIVDTALFKCYLLVRPGLLGPLCRVSNWCEVSEVEETLRAREKHSELIYLYNGKKMHEKALGLLRDLSEKEADPRDKLMPSVTYLQRLGPEYLEQIFGAARWVFEENADIAFEIFTSEEVELPREPVVDFVEGVNLSIAARYLVYLIEERNEESTGFHERLAETYLRMVSDARRRGDEEANKNAYDKLLEFIDTTDRYSADRLYALLPSDGFFEAKAILLGRLGRHDSALETYIYRLRDYHGAEEYCKRVYKPHTDTSNIFLTLLRTYLRPSPSSASSASDLLAPALDLISRHSPRLDVAETLDLLPPLVAARDVQAFLKEALRAPIFDTHVVREVTKARKDEVNRRLTGLQMRRVKVTDSRM
ncbi:vacuolar sorting protein 39 domain 1-domain-containing protein [Fomitopsis serialis]|uniref:vacuolar sorting protein 39 domain 1-domain-containing protein n=1 Tax=Fomitopsis serialis TaxID=139415 RepID=UPI00200791DE|nr:vacuolar sorting protein 39 domain 1-domain-containing protein [Neoantrodia serialis]KAH9928648.1 vacuolar sorting protein 39 domain 1-domain-containing protein [Neoantrodia serialis]